MMSRVAAASVNTPRLSEPRRVQRARVVALTRAPRTALLSTPAMRSTSVTTLRVGSSSANTGACACLMNRLWWGKQRTSNETFVSVEDSF